MIVHVNLRRKLGIGAAVLAAGAFGGGAYAATQSSGANDRQTFLNDVAKRLNVTPQALTAALKGAFSDELSAAVAAGKLTQAQANQIRQRMLQDGGVPFGGHLFFGPERMGGGRFFGPVGPGGPDGPGGPGGLGGTLRGALAAAAKYLGVTPAQLRDQLVTGKSLAQIATANHKSVIGLESAITDAVRTRLDQGVAAKRLTGSEEQQILSTLSAHLDALVKGAGLGPRFGTRRFFGHVGRDGAGSPGALSDPAGPPGPPGPAGATLPAVPPPPAY